MTNRPNHGFEAATACRGVDRSHTLIEENGLSPANLDTRDPDVSIAPKHVDECDHRRIDFQGRRGVGTE